MIIGTCELTFHLPGVTSLKDKRAIIKSLLARLRQQFNIAAAEVDRQDSWQTAVIGIATVTNSTRHANEVLQNVIIWIESNAPDAIITHQQMDIW
jgi:uncharacterized protein YlxP (DUF503 family)